MLDQARACRGRAVQRKSPNLSLGRVARLERLEHPRPDRGELGRSCAHDHRDDVAAVRRLELDQPPCAVDPEVDAVAGHPELELARGPGPVVAAAAGRRDQQRVRPLTLEHLAERSCPEIGLVVAQPLVVDQHDDLGTVPDRLARCVVEPVSEREPHYPPAELSRQLAALAQ